MDEPCELELAEVSTLVHRAVDGDSDALGELLRRFGPSVERKLRIDRPFRKVLDAGDVMQVTYLEAFLEIHTFQPERWESFEGWLARIAQNNLRDAITGLSRQKRQPPPGTAGSESPHDALVALHDHLVATSSTPSRVAVRRDVESLLRAAIDRLPPDYSAVVRSYDLEGHPIQQVADRLGRSAGAVHMLRARAHEKLGELLGTASGWFDSRA